tara:strand:+ start:1300 stop:1656 length:357 start_codon:yes stop_codon:yes gene_type:complete
MNLGTIVYTWLKGNFVGEDNMGNKYYTNSKNSSSINAKRWVIYNGEIEASKIPPHWHAWLHKTVNEPPLNYKPRYDWQKEHESNKTGTEDAYFPNSHPLSKSYKKFESESEYESWKPK